MITSHQDREPSFAEVGALIIVRNVLGNTDLKRVCIFREEGEDTPMMNEIVFAGRFDFDALNDVDVEDGETTSFSVELKTAEDGTFSVLLSSHEWDEKTLTSTETLETEVALIDTDDERWMDTLEGEFERVLHEKGIRPLSA